jgi:hypothetical protein
MYINNTNINLPQDPDTIVWKFRSSKFRPIDVQKLFMSRSDKFEDQYEGHLANLT